jgi:RNA polymerase sigma-70 factor, ECF subfamily
VIADAEEVRKEVDAIYRSEGPRVLSTLIRILGDLDMAEDAMAAAFAAAAERWPIDGVPGNPRAWLVSTGRFKAIDAIRVNTKLYAALTEIARRGDDAPELFPPVDESSIEDDRLRLIFTCCHPALPSEGQVALTLREVCGLTTEEIARAFLTSTPTIAQRIVRAKAKIREARIRYEVPPREELAERIQTVLQATYLLFSEGYYATSGDSLTKQVLSDEAIRLGRLVAELLPDPEVFGLLALMLLQESRRSARSSSGGDLILLADQDRTLWDQGLIEEGLTHCLRAFGSAELGPYAIQAGIAAFHVQGAMSGATDWDQIISLYDRLLDSQPSAVVELNQAAAVSMRDGPERALEIVDRLLAGGELDGYALAYATRADLCRRLERFAEARLDYARAIELTDQGSERRFLERRLREVLQTREESENL